MEALNGVDVTDASLYEAGIPHEFFARLRAEAPVHWNPQPPTIGGFPDEGFWTVATHQLVREVSRDSGTYSSSRNTAMPRYAEIISREQLEANRAILLNMDAPEHTRLRSIIAKVFTPRAVAKLRERLADDLSDLLATAGDAGSGNFVEQVAAELPMRVIADIIGVPERDRHKIAEWSTTMTRRHDPKVTGDPDEASTEVFAYANTLAAQRRAHPADDLVTRLVHAKDSDGALTDEEFGYFVVLLMVAGSETTRDAISNGLLGFRDNPGQWELFRRERPDTAADEVIRWASPVMSFQRTATADTELGGQHIRGGDRVVMLYAAANFDEDVFPDPLRFDVTRTPNPHVGFGGTGAHYCLGASLARLEVDLAFNALADRFPDITVVGPAERARSGWLNTVTTIPAQYGGCPVVGSGGA